MRQEMQKHLLALSPRNTQIVAANAGHHIKRDDPEFLVHVLRDMIAELRQRSSGAGLTGTAS